MISAVVEFDLFEAQWKGSSTHPSAGMSEEKKSAIAKKARAGGDIGKPGKNFCFFSCRLVSH